MGESPSLGCPVRSVFVPLPNKTQRCFFFLVHTHSFVSIPVTLLNIPVPFPTKTCSFFAQRCLRLNNPPHLQTYPNRSYELCLHVFILTSQYQNHHEALPSPPSVATKPPTYRKPSTAYAPVPTNPPPNPRSSQRAHPPGLVSPLTPQRLPPQPLPLQVHSSTRPSSTAAQSSHPPGLVRHPAQVPLQRIRPANLRRQLQEMRLPSSDRWAALPRR